MYVVYYSIKFISTNNAELAPKKVLLTVYTKFDMMSYSIYVLGGDRYDCQL